MSKKMKRGGNPNRNPNRNPRANQFKSKPSPFNSIGRRLTTVKLRKNHRKTASLLRSGILLDDDEDEDEDEEFINMRTINPFDEPVLFDDNSITKLDIILEKKVMDKEAYNNYSYKTLASQIIEQLKKENEYYLLEKIANGDFDDKTVSDIPAFKTLYQDQGFQTQLGNADFETKFRTQFQDEAINVINQLILQRDIDADQSNSRGGGKINSKEKSNIVQKGGANPCDAAEEVTGAQTKKCSKEAYYISTDWAHDWHKRDPTSKEKDEKKHILKEESQLFIITQKSEIQDLKQILKINKDDEITKSRINIKLSIPENVLVTYDMGSHCKLKKIDLYFNALDSSKGNKITHYPTYNRKTITYNELIEIMYVHINDGFTNGYLPINSSISSHWNGILPDNFDEIYEKIINLFFNLIDIKKLDDNKVFYTRKDESNPPNDIYKQITLNNLYGWMKYMIGDASILTRFNITCRNKGNLEDGFLKYFDWLVAPIFYELVTQYYPQHAAVAESAVAESAKDIYEIMKKQLQINTNNLLFTIAIGLFFKWSGDFFQVQQVRALGDSYALYTEDGLCFIQGCNYDIQMISYIRLNEDDLEDLDIDDNDESDGYYVFRQKFEPKLYIKSIFDLFKKIETPLKKVYNRSNIFELCSDIIINVIFPIFNDFVEYLKNNVATSRQYYDFLNRFNIILSPQTNTDTIPDFLTNYMPDLLTEYNSIKDIEPFNLILVIIQILNSKGAYFIEPLNILHTSQQTSINFEKLKNLSQVLKLSLSMLTSLNELVELYAFGPDTLKSLYTPSFNININNAFLTEIDRILDYTLYSFHEMNNDNVHILVLFGRMMFSKAGLKKKADLINLFPNIKKVDIDNIRPFTRPNKGINIIFGYGTKGNPNIIKYKLVFEYICDIITLAPQLLEISKPDPGKSIPAFITSVFDVLDIKTFYESKNYYISKINYTKTLIESIINKIINLRNNIIEYLNQEYDESKNDYNQVFVELLKKIKKIDIDIRQVEKTVFMDEEIKKSLKNSIYTTLSGNIRCFIDIKNLFERILNTLKSDFLEKLGIYIHLYYAKQKYGEHTLNPEILDNLVKLEKLDSNYLENLTREMGHILPRLE